jgi:hypothetical protein
MKEYAECLGWLACRIILIDIGTFKVRNRSATLYCRRVCLFPSLFG